MSADTCACRHDDTARVLQSASLLLSKFASVTHVFLQFAGGAPGSTTQVSCSQVFTRLLKCTQEIADIGKWLAVSIYTIAQSSPALVNAT